MPLFIGESPAPIHQSPPGWMWLKPVAGGLEIHSLVDGSWVLQATMSFSDHSHAELGDINFTGTISAGGYTGHNERVTIGTKKLTFKEGLCILVEDV